MDTNQEIKLAVKRIVAGHVGRDNAIKAGDIAAELDLDSDRHVRAAVRELRKEGHLILSSVSPPYGYYLAASLEEWVAFRDSNLKPRALDILSTARAMGRAAMVKFGRQTAMFEVEPFSTN